MLDRLRKLVWVWVIACGIGILHAAPTYAVVAPTPPSSPTSTSTTNTNTNITLNPNANATFINRMTIEMGGVYFYNSNTIEDNRDGWIYKALNADCPASIKVDTNQIAIYQLTYSVKTGGTCSAPSSQAVGVDSWDQVRFIVFGHNGSDIVSTRAEVTTAFKKSSVPGLSVDTYVQDIAGTSCPSIIVNRGGGNWQFIPVMTSGPAEADADLKVVLGQTAVCRVANGGVNTPTSPGSIFNYYGLPRTYGDTRTDKGFKLLSSSKSDMTTFQLTGISSVAGVAGAGPLSNLASSVTGGGSASGGKETCNVDGVGWIICPLAVFIGKTTDAVYTMIEYFMKYEIPNALGDNPLKSIWSSVLSIANVSFIIAFFVIIFSQATSIGISSYGVKKMLPRMIAAAILVNLSYYICVFAVDVSNIIGAGLDGLIMSGLPDAKATLSQTHWETAIVGALSLAVGVAAAPAIIAAAITFAVPALLAVLTTLLILVGRYALLTILIAISPLAFVAFILPGTEGLFDKWRKTFITLLVFYPMVAVLFAGSKAAAYIILLQ